MSTHTSTMSVGNRSAPSTRLPYRSGSPSMPQCTGMLSGSLPYTAAVKTITRRTTTAGYHLRIFVPSGAGWRPRVAFGRTYPFHQVIHDVLEDRGIELVDYLLSVALREDESRVAEDAEVA